MTLIVTINGPDTIWILADRRLSFAHQAPRDDARKMMVLDTTDGVALLGYAGLGRTAGRTEPADWMNRVLRGRDLPMEQCLDVLAEAFEREMPRHLATIPRRFAALHNILISAVVNEQARLYELSLVMSPDRRDYRLVRTRHVTGRAPSRLQLPQRFSAAGSGAAYLTRDPRWQRELLRLVRACDRGLIVPQVVADRLAQLNLDVSLGTADKTVGPRCIVMWRHRKGSFRKGGGGHQFYSGSMREGDSGAVPWICRGQDLQAIGPTIGSVLIDLYAIPGERRFRREVDPDAVNAAMNAAMAKLPHMPDEGLK